MSARNHAAEFQQLTASTTQQTINGVVEMKRKRKKVCSSDHQAGRFFILPTRLLTIDSWSASLFNYDPSPGAPFQH